MSTVDSTNPHQFSYDPETGVCYRTLDFLGFPGYRVGDDGSVWSRKEHERIRSSRGGTRSVLGKKWRRIAINATARGGYPRTTLMSPQGNKGFRVHQLVLLAFTGPSPNNQECCHKDGNPTNNNITNLRWGTRKENAGDRVRHGRQPKGESSVRSTLTEAAVRDIWLNRGKVCQRLLAKKHNTSMSTIGHIHNRRVWTHITDCI